MAKLWSDRRRLFRAQAAVNVADPQLLRRCQPRSALTDYGPLDILNVASTAGLSGDYDALRDRALVIEFHEVTLAVRQPR